MIVLYADNVLLLKWRRLILPRLTFNSDEAPLVAADDVGHTGHPEPTCHRVEVIGAD